MEGQWGGPCPAVSGPEAGTFPPQFCGWFGASTGCPGCSLLCPCPGLRPSARRPDGRPCVASVPRARPACAPRPGRARRAEPPQPQGLRGSSEAPPGGALGSFPPGSPFLLPAPSLWGSVPAAWAPSGRARRVPAPRADLTAGKGPSQPGTAHPCMRAPRWRQTQPLARAGPHPVFPPLPRARGPQLASDRDQVLPASGGGHSPSAPGRPPGSGRVGRWVDPARLPSRLSLYLLPPPKFAL